ncbi:MAG: hypothetical protein KDK96_11190 [Chlamydiia bacterium]|nr:hypothetical protein [Chlamydiia bacterium]
MSQFFRYLLIQENGIYTLWGDKPMTVFEVETRSKEELAPFYADIPLELITIPIDPNKESERIKCQKLSKAERERVVFVNYDELEFMSKWERWSEKQKTLSINNYILLMKEGTKDKLPTLFFINIKETALILKQNYSLFREVFGEDFDPLNVIFEIKEQESAFWSQVMSDDWCRGVLFGFGKKNSWCFCWKYRNNPEEAKEFTSNLKGRPSEKHSKFKVWTIEEFNIPGFASFSEEDPFIKKYQQQRKKIIEIYKGKDFVELSLQKLIE